jgi:hypothetical protein
MAGWFLDEGGKLWAYEKGRWKKTTAFDPPLSSNARYTELVPGMLALRTDGVVEAQSRDAQGNAGTPFVVPSAPMGTAYVGVDGQWEGYDVGGGPWKWDSIFGLLRSDGVIVVAEPSLAESDPAGGYQEIALPAGRNWVRIGVAGLEIGAVDSQGGGVVISCPVKGRIPGKYCGSVQEVPRETGIAFSDVRGAEGWVRFLDSEGRLMTAGNDESQPGAFGSLWALKFTGFLADYGGLNPICSDGGLCGGLSDPTFGSLYNGSFFPAVPKGWRIVAGAVGGNRAYYAIAKISRGVRMDTGIWSYGGIPDVPVAGKPWNLIVGLRSQGVLKGGTVVVRRGAKIVGRLRLTKEPTEMDVNVPIKVSKLSKTKPNTLTVQFLGTKTAKKSAKVTVEVKPVKVPRGKSKAKSK